MISSREGGPNNWGAFVYLDKIYKFGARAELFEMLEGRPWVVTFSFSTFPLECSTSPQDDLGSVALKLALQVIPPWLTWAN